MNGLCLRANVFLFCQIIFLLCCHTTYQEIKKYIFDPYHEGMKGYVQMVREIEHLGEEMDEKSLEPILNDKKYSWLLFGVWGAPTANLTQA